MLIIDDFSYKGWVYIFSAEFEAFSRFQEWVWVSLDETETSNKLCGPMQPTLGGVRYFMLRIDDFSYKFWVYLLSAKIDAFSRFQEWVSLNETATSDKIQKIRSDF